MAKNKNIVKLIKEVRNEMSCTGGGTSGASFNSGTGEQYSSPQAFSKKRKMKGIIVKQLWK